MKTWIVILFAAACFCRGQEPSVDFLCKGHSNWVSTIKFLTSADRIRFVGPLDHVYGNACEAQKGGVPVIVIDSLNRSVEIRTDMPPGSPFFCAANYAPVYSMAAEFGPLGLGDWVFWSSAYRFTNFFTVYPAPASALEVRSRLDHGQVHLEWSAVSYLDYDVESSTTLTNWQGAGVNFTFDGITMRATVLVGTGHQFFRIKRSPILQPLTPYPTNCVR